MKTILLSSILVLFAGFISFGQDNGKPGETMVITKIIKNGDTNKKIIEILTTDEDAVDNLVDSLEDVHGEDNVEINVIKLPGFGGDSPFNWIELEDLGDFQHIFEMGDQMKWMDMEEIVDIRDFQWKEEDKPFLGVIIDTDEQLERGIHILNIVEESAAEEAGMEKDDILLAVEDQEINSLSDLGKVLQGHQIGDEISLVFLRGEKEIRSTAKLKSRAESNYDLAKSFNFKKSSCCEGDVECEIHSGKAYKAFVHKQRPKLGVYVEDLDPEMIEDLNVEGGTGVLVTKVLEETAAKKMGLKVNDVLLTLNEKEISDVATLHEVLGEQKLGDDIKITYLRYGTKKTATGVLFEFSHQSAIDKMIFYQDNND
jgi:membrane-associated protease RseP (regulator of RpoE activity)